MDYDISGVSDEAKVLSEFLQTVLDNVVSVYESHSMPIPARRYWTLGTPATDCEQLVVDFMQMYIGFPGDEANEPRKCDVMRSATVHVNVSRPAPSVSDSGEAPDAALIQRYSQLVAYDAWVLMQSAGALDAWAQENGVGMGVIATVDVASPEGGYHTTIMTLTMAIP